MMSVVDQTFDHAFRKKAGRILASGQSHSLLLTGNVHDLFYLPQEHSGVQDGTYVSLVEYLRARWGRVKDTILIVYEINGPIRFADPADRELIRNAWPQTEAVEDAESIMRSLVSQVSDKITGKTAKTPANEFDDYMIRAINRPAVAMQMLRRFCELSRTAKPGSPLHGKQLLILIEWADMIIPDGEVSRLQEADRHRVTIFQDWFSDPEFMHGTDSVVLITESSSMVNHRVTRLPQMMEVEIQAPNEATRLHFINWYEARHGTQLKLWADKPTLSAFSAGLSLHALHQLLLGAIHDGEAIKQEDVIARVEAYIISQLGEGVVEFKKPRHQLKDVVGYKSLKDFLQAEVIPRFRSTGPDTLSGAAVSGPIGAGKTFIFEAVAAELGIPVLVLKNLRSKWFGETDVITERLYRVLMSLSKVMIFIDEADTMFGGVGPDAHETERRLTGKIQTWMSDPILRGKVTWLLMTARIHRLSPDIRRPGRVGSLIIPILDPTQDDRDEFIRWVLKPVMTNVPGPKTKSFERVRAATATYSSAAFSELRSELTALTASGKTLMIDQIVERIEDQIPPDIGPTREYQTLQALMNTTRRSLLPDPKVDLNTVRAEWAARIRAFEREGIC